MVRNAICAAIPDVSVAEDVMLALPRHSSGEISPLTDYMHKDIRAPLLVSIGAELACHPHSHSDDSVDEWSDDFLDNGEGSSDDDVSSSSTSSSGSSMTRFLALCERPRQRCLPTPVRYEHCPAELNVHVLTFSPSKALPAKCSIPLVCMANKNRLPVLMLSILYQRHVWQIPGPVIGVAFSKFGTSITLHFGWLDHDTSSERVLPQGHIGCFDCSSEINLTDSHSALLLLRFFWGLEDCFSMIRNAADCAKSKVTEYMRQHPTVLWRLDTCSRVERTMTFDNHREKISMWIQGLEHKFDVSMPDQLSLPSDPSSPSPTSCEDTPLSPTITVSSPAPQEMDSAIDGVFKLATKSMSCSEFARRSAESRDDIPVFEWLFDRNAVVLSVLHDQEMQQKYDRIAQFIWPSKWKRLGDLPNVDENVRFLLHDLTKQVLLAERGGNLDLSTTPDIPEDIFPLLVGSFSAIFQACKHSQIKAHSSGTVPEAAWRHDHGRLFFDFFNNAGDGKYSLSVGLDEFQSQSVSQSGDASSPSDHAENSDSSNPPVYPSLGRLLWLPGSNLIDKEGTHKETELDDLTRFLRRLEMSKGTLESWVAKSEQYRATKFLEDRDQGYIQFQAFTWQEQCSRDHLLARLGEAPTKGVCDALGTLRVIIDVPHKLLDNVRLASLDPPKRSYLESKIEESKGEKEKQPAKRSRAGRTRSERRSEVTSSDRLTTPEGGVETSQDYKYNILASTKRTPVTQDLLHKDTDMVSELATQMSRLKVSVLPKGPSESILELPLIFAEYKKATTTVAQGTNQHRMYCVAAARFLESLGITNYPIFSVVTDGPQAVLASAWTKQGRVYIFERHTQSFDISTAIGAWHYATVLCRIAVWQSRELYAKFAEVKDELVQRLKGSDKTLRWKMKHQLETLDASNVAKRPPRAKNQKKDEE